HRTTESHGAGTCPGAPAEPFDHKSRDGGCWVVHRRACGAPVSSRCHALLIHPRHGRTSISTGCRSRAPARAIPHLMTSLADTVIKIGGSLLAVPDALDHVVHTLRSVCT